VIYELIVTIPYSAVYYQLSFAKTSNLYYMAIIFVISLFYHTKHTAVYCYNCQIILTRVRLLKEIYALLLWVRIHASRMTIMSTYLKDMKMVGKWNVLIYYSVMGNSLFMN